VAANRELMYQMTEAATQSQVPWWREPTKGQWVSFLAAWFGWVMDAFDFTVFLVVMPEITKEFGVTQTSTAFTITLTLLVRLIGGYVAGAAADRWGRKLPLMISILWFAACDGAIALAPSFLWVLALRTLFGFGMGAEWTSGATLAMENWPARSRGIASGVLQGSWAIGYFGAAQVAGFVVPRYGWRAVFVIAALPALLVLPIRAFVPESPALEKRSKEPRDKRAEAGLGRILAPDMLGRLAWACLIMAFGFGAYYGLTSSHSTLLKVDFAIDPTRAGNIISLFNVGMMVGAILCGFAASRIGVVVAVMVPALLVPLALPLHVGNWAGHLGLGAFLGGLFGAGYSGVTPLLLTSLFPAEIRARCVGLAYHVGACVAAFVPPAITLLVEKKGLRLADAITYVAGTCALLLALSMLLRPKGVKTETAPDAGIKN
jgi:SHS family lactate transporter-like MFS transporter